MGFCRLGIEAEGAAVTRHCILRQALQLQGVAEVEVGLGQVAVDGERLSETGDGLVEPAQRK